MPRNIISYLTKVNVQYSYEDEDFQRIFASCIKDFSASNAQSFGKPILCFGTVNIANIKDALSFEKTQRTNSRILLIPYMLSQGHVIGVLLDIAADGKLLRALYMDSLLLDDELEPNRALQTQIASVYPECVLQFHSCLRQPETDFTSSGAYAIENLLNAARNLEVIAEQPSAKVIRAQHLRSLDEHDNEFYNKFMPKQRERKASIIPPSATNVTAVPYSVDELFLTLYVLNLELESLFFPKKSIDEQREENERRLNEESRQIFKTVCDSQGILRLQLQNAAQNRWVAKFLQVREWRTDKKGFILDYAVPEGICLAGGVTSYATGLGFSQAWQIFWAAETTAEGVMLGAAAAFNPWVAVPTLGLTATSFIGTRQARNFALQINEALKLSLSSSKDDLGYAKNILESQLGITNKTKSAITRALRWPMTPQDQFDFAHLLLARIRVSLEKSPTIDGYKWVYEKTNNKFIKGMALVGQINILSQKSASKLDPNDRTIPESENEELRLLGEKIKLLNSKEFETIVVQYFSRVLLAFRIMFEKTQKREFLKSREDFAETRMVIEQFLKFNDLHCLRYMGEHGKLAETVFTFLQALCEIFYEEHYKTTESTSNKQISPNQTESAQKARSKLKECQKLISAFKLDNAEFERTSHSRIMEIISNFTIKYIAAYEEDRKQRSDSHSLQMTSQFYMRTTRPLQQQQIEAVINNAFRDVPDVSSSEREALEISLLHRYGV